MSASQKNTPQPLHVNANDIFCWACADSEPIAENNRKAPSEIIDLYRLTSENETYGGIKWLCLKRDMQPQPPVKKMMVDAHYWDDELESLPKNPFDKDFDISL